MADIIFNITAFRSLFPAYANETTYPDIMVTAYWEVATAFISKTPSCSLPTAALTYVLDLLTAHLLFIATAVAADPTALPGIEQSATIDKVSVTNAIPPYGNSAWAYWLSQSPYGQQLLAFLSMKAVGGLYVADVPERAAFRKAYGVF